MAAPKGKKYPTQKDFDKDFINPATKLAQLRGLPKEHKMKIPKLGQRGQEVPGPIPKFT